MPSNKVTTKKHFVWTELDSWGLPFGIKRLPMESNRDFKERLLTVMGAHGDSSRQGLIDGLSALFRVNTYNSGDQKHFYLNLTPFEYNDSGTVLNITVSIDNTTQTQNIEYYSPEDWMSGGRDNYVFDTDAEGFIIWRDTNGKYTDHLEFLTAPPSGTAITINYWTKIGDDYLNVIETVNENPSLVPQSETTPNERQITIQQLFDSDFISEHTKSTGVPDESLQKIISDVNEIYPFQWGDFIWDKFHWDVKVNEGLLPSYYDGTTQSGDFKSGTGHGDALKIEDIDAVGQPKIHPGYLYYAGREFYMYKLMDYQESESGDYDVTLVDESGNYVNINRNAPVVVKAQIPTSLLIAPTGSLLTGKSQIFPYDNEDPTNTVFTLTAGTPSNTDYISVKRYQAGDAETEVGWVYTAVSNTITLLTALESTQELVVIWPESDTRYISVDVTESVNGTNIARTHEEGYRIIMDDLVTTSTLDSDLVIVTEGDHNHYVKLTDPYLQNGVLEDEAIAGESGNIAPIMGLYTTWYPDEAGYMELLAKDHTHTIVSGAVQSANITLNDGTILSHTHAIVFPTNFGWVEPTSDILPHKPNPKSISLVSGAAQTFLETAWDNISLDSETYAYGSYTMRQESGGLRMDIAGSVNPHTVFYERGAYVPDEDYYTLSPADCPSLHYAQGKILVIGKDLPAFFLNIYPERTVVSEWGKALGITIEALDTEGLGSVKDCTISITPSGDYCTVDTKIDNIVTNIYGTVYVRPVIGEGGTAITKGDTFSIVVEGEFTTKYKYDKPIPSSVTESESGPVGDKTYTYTITKTSSLTWIGD